MEHRSTGGPCLSYLLQLPQRLLAVRPLVQKLRLQVQQPPALLLLRVLLLLLRPLPLPLRLPLQGPLPLQLL